MNLGDLNKRIEIQYPTNTSDAMGGFTVVWATSIEVWASIWPVSANETIQAQGQNMEITHRIRIRYIRSAMNSAWRIKYGVRYFNIVSIINQNEKGRVLDILAKEAT